MHPSYELEEYELLQDQDPEECKFHHDVTQIVPYITLAESTLGYPILVQWLSDEEMKQLLQRNNKSSTTA